MAPQPGFELTDVTGWKADRWDELAVASSRGHVFQSWAWAAAKASLGWQPRRYTIEQAGRLAAVASVLERPMPHPLRRYRFLYAPRGPVLLEESDSAARAALEALRQLARDRKAVVLTVDPAWEEGGSRAAILPLVGFQPAPREIQVSRTAMIVPLFTDEAEQHRRLSDSAARNINRALRRGVLVERVDSGNAARWPQALADFYTAYEATGRRQGFIVRDRGYLLAGWNALGRAGHASVWFACEGRQIQSGVLLYHCGSTLVSALAGTPDVSDLRDNQANYLLQWKIMRWASGERFTQYDLGGVDTHASPGFPTSPKHPLWGLWEFKLGFGAEPVLYVRAHDYAPSRTLGVAWRAARSLRAG